METNKQTMDDTLIEMAQSEVGLVNEELDIQTEKYMSLQKKLGLNSEILDRNRALLTSLKKRTEMKEIMKFVGLIFLVVVLVVGISHYKQHFNSFKSLSYFFR